MQPNQPWGNPNAQQAQNPYGQPYAPTNPYAAPNAGPPALYRQNVFVPYGASAGPLVGPTLRKVKLGLGVAQLLAMIGGISLMVLGGVMGNDVGGVFAIIGGVLFGLWYLLLFGYAIANAVWIYQFWSWIPPDQRHTSMWKKYISPGTAIGFMFIPYFNLYWMFVVYLGISDILERMRVQYPTQKPPAKTLALVALIGPLVFFPAAPILQYLFAKHVEEMATEMQSRMAGGVPQGY